jgi:BMFP domain-containing protein YqiC
MEAFFASLPSWLGTLPQMISAGGILGILGLLLNAYRARGDITIRERQVTVEADKVEADIEQKVREHLSAELSRLADEVEKAKQRQLQCETREERLRQRVHKLEDEVTGLHRVIAFNSSTLLLGGDGRPSEAVREAAIRVLETLARGDVPGEGEISPP